MRELSSGSRTRTRGRRASANGPAPAGARADPGAVGERLQGGEGLDAEEELRPAAGAAQDLVGARVEGREPLARGVPVGQGQDGRPVPPRAQPGAEVEAGAVGGVGIDRDDVAPAEGREREGVLRVGRDHRLEPRLDEGRLDRPGVPKPAGEDQDADAHAAESASR